MSLEHFHPVTRRWFEARFSAPTEAQARGWPSIAAGRDTLIAAPTGSGKTLAAFLSSVDRLLREALAGSIDDRPRVVYVSPLRALSNDIHRNLEMPLAEILAAARAGHPRVSEIRVALRTGDTPPSERQRMLRRPPHIVVTTPESLYLLLTGARSREILESVDTVIVDEIHALADDKRGSHLALSLERLSARCARRPLRIGLSATQAPIEEIGRYLVGRSAMPEIVNVGHLREVDLRVEVPPLALGAVCMLEHWEGLYQRLIELIASHHSTLIFVNTRRLAERVTHRLSERLGAHVVASHHGSLAQHIRHDVEQRLRGGALKAVVATASLELGIDIGHIDLVCQIGTPRAMAALLQRLGRAGHSLGAIPKARLFATTRDDLLECLALVRAIYGGELDRIRIPEAPLDILAQQITAMAVGEEWEEDALFEVCGRAYPYRDLSRSDFDDVLRMLSEGPTGRRGDPGTYLHHDGVNRRVRARRNARVPAVTCGGAIPDVAEYRVVTDEAASTVVGSVDEDFAVESMAGDVFVLGTSSWRIQHIRNGQVVVSDAHGAAPNVPFWRGEAPGRTPELSSAFSRFREEIAARAGDVESATEWVMAEGHAGREAAAQAVAYVAAQVAAVGFVPTRKKILFERFFDQTGGMQVVVHAPLGTAVNRAWGLALRKRFCRSFDFELQASAGDNGIVLSLGEQHSFPLEEMFAFLTARGAREVLEQAVLAAPFFATRWRWNVTRALAVRRFDRGRPVPPPIQRMRADDLMTAVFPAQTACRENVTGDIAIPDHPLVRQTMEDCLREAMDVERWLELLEEIERGLIELVPLDTREPSPFSHELLNANPFAFLDDAPLEERRARAVSLSRSISIESVSDLGRLDPEAVETVRQDAWPLVRDADELHDALLSFVALPATDGEAWAEHFGTLVRDGRATVVHRSGLPPLWVAAENWGVAREIWPDATASPAVPVPGGGPLDGGVPDRPRELALARLVHGRLEAVGPVTAGRVAESLRLASDDVRAALLRIEGEGRALRGRFTPAAWGHAGDDTVEWCDRRLLTRIHRLTIEGLRRRIQPVTVDGYLRFVGRHQHAHPDTRVSGPRGVARLVAMLQGFEAPAAEWEPFLFAARMDRYDPLWLDTLCLSGEVMWARLRRAQPSETAARPMAAFSRVVPITLMRREDLAWLAGPPARGGAEREDRLTSRARRVLDLLRARGALFSAEISAAVRVLPEELEDALGELSRAGLITSDGFGALRALIGSSAALVTAQTVTAVDRRSALHARAASRTRRARARARGGAHRQVPYTGRWSVLDPAPVDVRDPARADLDARDRSEAWCRQLLARYGVVFRELLQREPSAPRWFDLVRVYRRLEARGEVRGGRFVRGVAGEQYALPDAIEPLRRAADPEPEPSRIRLAASDPLNLYGWITGDAKVAATSGNRITVMGGRLA
jgi:ATP-dependent Lhr-like helicase